MTAPNPNNPNATIAPPTVAAVGTAPNLTNDPGLAGNPQFTIDINSNSPPPQKTLVYSPDVQILIAHGNKQYDVSRDIVSCSVQRNENAISTLVFKLANKDRRYMQMFERMDRVVCIMKRVSWHQTFSGYLDYVPYVQCFPGVVNFRASCTLKRVLHTIWNPGLPQSALLMQQATANLNEQAAGENQTDMGLGSLLRRFLVEVGGWNPSNVHVQRFPPSYFTFMEDQLKKSQDGIQTELENFKQMMLGGGDTSGGTWQNAGKVTGVSRGSYAIPQGARQLEVIKAVNDMGMGPDISTVNAAQGLNTAAGHSGDNKDKTAWTEQSEVARNWENYGKESDAAINCFMTIMAESSFQMYANNAVPDSLNFPNDGVRGDGTSVGLYQQTEGNNWGTVAQRMNVRESTQMFLQRLNQYNWRNMDRATACQSVQGSAISSGSNYAKFEQAAIDAVRTIRMNQAPGSAASATTDPTKVSLPGGEQQNIPAPPGPAPNLNNLTAPLNSGSPQGAVNTATARPQFDTAGAIAYARLQIGKPYVWGQAGPASFDCSGLVMMAYKAININFGRTTYDMMGAGQVIPAAQAKPGDLLFPNGGDHVVMVSDVPGMIIEAPHSGAFVREVPIPASYIGVAARHVPSTEWGGPGAAAFNPFPTSPGYSPGSVADGPNGSTASVSPSEPIARNLFTYMFIGAPAQNASSIGTQPGTEEKAFILCEPMLPTVITLASAGLRKFQSLPNGDFAAYYPDYFGLDNKKAVLTLRDIEMKNVSIDLNDDALVTHSYVAGSQSVQASDMGIAGWIFSKGFATVENEWLFSRMAKAAPAIQGQRLTNGKDIMRRFGARPLAKTMPMVQSGPMEFLCAVQQFMECWAQQYSTQVEFTFMPELYPGMRVMLDGHGFQVYVSQVTHNCDFENGFSTTATICAPSNVGLGQLVSALGDEAKSIADQLGQSVDDLIIGATTAMQ